mmetsp:Transcript_6105/g.18099  ORF Transcript_6105/g.18099 Transcript_6105/m.18099 type:complete len:304 (-) Transcript_6105:686-1597(-)
MLPEQELASQVGKLNAVGVCHCEQAILTTTHAVQGVVLQELAAQGPAADHEVLQALKLGDEGVAEDRCEVVVPRVPRRAVRGRRVGQDLHGVQMQKTWDRRELAGQLDHFLGHDAAKEGAEGLELHPEVPHELPEQLLVDLDLQGRILRGKERLRLRHHGAGVLCGHGRLTLGLHSQRGVEGKVDLQLRAEVDHVGTHHAVEGDARVLDRLGQGLEWVGGADLLLGHQPSTGVGRELRGVPDAHGVDWVARFRADLPGCHHVPTRRRLLVRGQTVAPHHIGKLHVAALGEGPWRLPIRHRDPH